MEVVMKITKKYIQDIINEELAKEGFDSNSPEAKINKAKAGLEEVRSRLEGMAMGQEISPERVLGMVDEVALRLDLALDAVKGGQSPMMEETPVVQEFMPRPGEVPAEGERLDPHPSMEEVAKSLEEAAKVLVTGNVLGALHHQGKKDPGLRAAFMYDRANKLFNELLNLRDELREL
tara:strand:+ start:375 stop:905 length:531 start_codon:yes stop_codon:yes gene_type:complete